jgi:hypothetical protein
MHWLRHGQPKRHRFGSGYPDCEILVGCQGRQEVAFVRAKVCLKPIRNPAVRWQRSARGYLAAHPHGR